MSKTGDKGYALEELLRSYFLRAGMYVARGIPLKFGEHEITDVDIWLYERPTGSFRRRQIVDVKSKAKPKAFERMLWTKGLYDLLKVDGAYVATTDDRPVLKEVSARLGLSVLDGVDIKRIEESDKIPFNDRISEEIFIQRIKSVDKNRRNKELYTKYLDLKSVLVDNFGSGTLSVALGFFGFFAKTLITCHPDSASAEVALRLTYVSASISALTLDYNISRYHFKSNEDRYQALVNIIRFGSDDARQVLKKIDFAVSLVDRYVQNGRSISQSMRKSLFSDFDKIPAEGIAEYVISKLKGDALFNIACSTEFEGFRSNLKGFYELDVDEKAFLGLLMDFSRIDRFAFTQAWGASQTRKLI